MGVPNQPSRKIADIDVLWITAGLGCDGDTIAMTAATQPSIEDIVTRRHSLDTQSASAQPISFVRERRRVSAAFSPGGRGRAGTFHPGGRRLDSQRKQQGGGLLGLAWHRCGNGTAHHHLRMDRPARAQCLGGDRGRNLCHVWRYPRHGGESDRMHGPARLPWVAMEVEDRAFRSSACRAVPCSRTILWRRCSICFTWLPDVRR